MTYDPEWAWLSSWHVVKGNATRCGRWLNPDSPRTTTLPSGQRTCETCLRLLARDGEKMAAGQAVGNWTA